MLRCNLPESIVLSDGTELYPVVGRHLRQEPFITVDVGASSDVGESHLIVNEAKRRGLRYRRIEVLSRNLRGKLDLYRQPYRPTRWVFVEVKPGKGAQTNEKSSE